MSSDFLWHGQTRRAQHLAHGGSVRLPRFHFMTQLAPALRSEPIELGLAVVLRESPLRFQQPLVLQPPQRGIERPFFDQQRVVALPPDEVGDGVAVKRLPTRAL